MDTTRLRSATMEILPLFVPPPTLRFQPIRSTSGQIIVEWIGTALLEEARNVQGPWQGIPNATTPFILAPSAPSKFFR
jgi:hypothetical protein